MNMNLHFCQKMLQNDHLPSDHLAQSLIISSVKKKNELANNKQKALDGYEKH